MQVSDKGGQGWGCLGGRDSKAIPQRQAACHSRVWTLETARVLVFPTEARNATTGASDIWV